MKYLVKFIVVTFFLLVSTNTFAEQKIVILDLAFVLNNSKAGKGAQDFLTKSYNDNLKKFKDMEENLKSKEKDLLSKKEDLSKKEYKKETDSLRKKVIEYQSTRRSALDKITSQRAESREKLMKTVEPIVDAYIKENGISLVVDKKSTFGGTPDIDITEFIVDKLNKELPSLNLK